MVAVVVAVVAVIALGVVDVEGWSHVGHEITAAIAHEFLNENVAFDVSAMLANDGGRMENVASWADKIKHQAGWGWTSPLHHVNVDLICPKGRCLTAAIANYSSRLLSRTDPESSYIDLKFLVHYLGDINQPLHISTRNNRGGNNERGRFCRRKTNLHEIWDDLLIQRRIRTSFRKSKASYIESIVTRVRTGNWSTASWIDCRTFDECSRLWAMDTALLSASANRDELGNDIVDGFDLCDEYYMRHQDSVDVQLAKGGVRLAYLLNWIWDNPPSYEIATAGSVVGIAKKPEEVPAHVIITVPDDAEVTDARAMTWSPVQIWMDTTRLSLVPALLILAVLISADIFSGTCQRIH